MSDPTLYLTLATSALLATGILSMAGLTAFRAWLDLKRAELASRSEPAASSVGFTGSRIEIADLKERLRKLEAIAAGVDL
jgi:hypothetical protein